MLAESAIRAWVNENRQLTGKDQPLRQGAYLEGMAVRSPAHGAYARLIREMGVDPDVVAEPGGPQRVRITAHVFAGTIDAAEKAAGALCDAWRHLAGRPEPCGDTGVLILAAANFSGPGYVETPGGGGEQHEFTVSCEFILYQES